MQRRDFLFQGSLITTGFTFQKFLPGSVSLDDNDPEQLYPLFKNPAGIYKPFVRWWWNGDKIEREEITRELHLLKQAGIGGVEINPIKFPPGTNDLGKRSVKWLSPEWVSLLQFTLTEARSLGLTCDLIVGSGWPFGADWLEGKERTQMVSIAVKKLEGPLDYEISLYELFREADPAITSPYSGRTMELVSLYLAPSPLNDMDEVKDISDKASKGNIGFSIEEGSYVLYALISINGFMEVINGAPGADGPALNHYNEAAVKKYLDKMSSAIGTVAGRIRSFFTDSMELEGANWCNDMLPEFKKRRGYDLLPYLPFILFRTGSMGNIFDYTYGVEFGQVLKEKLNRIRYDFEHTKTELLRERFVQPFINWCKDNKVQSRMQAYGRGYHPLDGSFGVDIPECETWIKAGLGTKMSEEDYREGRAYSMINKYVSSAVHLQGKREISCEELTNTDRVFNETLELLKLASDQSIVSGVTHAIFHGFNYSPQEAEFPGWVRYGTFFNERNPWWPYVNYFTAYRARLAAIFQQADMYADIAILTPIADMWSMYGAQNEPFPTLVHPSYQTLIWEAIHKNGSGCDYVSEKILQDSIIHHNYIQYKERKYHTLFLVEVESMEPATAQKLFEFISSGGKIFCIEKYPAKSTGWYNYLQRDAEVQSWVSKMKNYPDRFIFLKKPKKNLLEWYQDIQQQYQLVPYVKIDKPDLFVNQIRYEAKGAQIFFFINSNIDKGYSLNVTFFKEVTYKRKAWVWNPENGERQMLLMNSDTLLVNMGPAESKLIVFDDAKKGNQFRQPLLPNDNSKQIINWIVEWKHIDGSVKQTEMAGLKDIKDIPEFASFCGVAIYRTNLSVDKTGMLSFLNLGKVYGISEVWVNEINCGVQWYGNRIYAIANKLKTGLNTIEVKITTTMGNYMKTLKKNPVAQYWTNEKSKDQPLQSMGMTGPVTLY